MENVKEARLEAMRRILHETFGGKKASLAQKIGRSPSQVGQWFSGVRTISEESARDIEEKLRLEPGSLDGVRSPKGRISIVSVERTVHPRIQEESPHYTSNFWDEDDEKHQSLPEAPPPFQAALEHSISQLLDEVKRLPLSHNKAQALTEAVQSLIKLARA